MNKKLSFLKNYLTKDLKLCEFGLTNICSCKCSFCSIWKQQPKIIVKTEEAIKTINHLKDLGVNVITLTGGEPLIHPDFDKIIKACNDCGIFNAILNADARLFTNQVINKLAINKPDIVSISIDHHTDKVEFESRKIKDLLKHIKRAVKRLKKHGIKTMASIVICNYNHKSLKELCDKCMEFGFEQIAINYPEISESEVYELGGNAINLTNEDVIKALEVVKELKKDYPIVNPVTSIDNIISFLKGEPVKYDCLGGNRVFFVDWHLNTYPCMHLNKNFGNILSLSKKDFNMKPCNCCNMSWYRDFSVYLLGAKSLIPLLKDLPSTLKYI